MRRTHFSNETAALQVIDHAVVIADDFALEKIGHRPRSPDERLIFTLWRRLRFGGLLPARRVGAGVTILIVRALRAISKIPACVGPGI